MLEKLPGRQQGKVGGGGGVGATAGAAFSCVSIASSNSHSTQNLTLEAPL